MTVITRKRYTKKGMWTWLLHSSWRKKCTQIILQHTYLHVRFVLGARAIFYEFSGALLPTWKKVIKFFHLVIYSLLSRLENRRIASNFLYARSYVKMLFCFVVSMQVVKTCVKNGRKQRKIMLGAINATMCA